MKHAFLIIAHNNWNQIRQFISAVDNLNCDFFIHVNKKIALEKHTIEDVQQGAQKSKVFFTDRVPIVWGRAGICKASIILLEQAYIYRKYDYYHLMTGSDLLLKSFDEFDSFFEQNLYNNDSGGEYRTNYISSGLPNRKVLSRLLYYNFFISQWRNPNRIVRKAATLTNSALCLLQSIIGINRVKNSEFSLFYGSSWWSISDEFARYYLREAKKFIDIFSDKTFAIDEFCPQTIIENSSYKKSLYLNPNGIERNLRLIDFQRGNGYGSPHIWTIGDKDEILKTNNLFGRKFNSEIDSEIVKVVLDAING